MPFFWSDKKAARACRGSNLSRAKNALFLLCRICLQGVSLSKHTGKHVFQCYPVGSNLGLFVLSQKEGSAPDRPAKRWQFTCCAIVSLKSPLPHPRFQAGSIIVGGVFDLAAVIFSPRPPSPSSFLPSGIFPFQNNIDLQPRNRHKQLYFLLAPLLKLHKCFDVSPVSCHVCETWLSGCGPKALMNPRVRLRD